MNDIQKTEKEKHLVKMAIFIAMVVIFVMLVFGFVWLNGYRFSVAKNSKPQEQITVNIDSMKSSLEDMASLATEEYNFTNVATFTEEKAKVLFISIPFTDKKLIMTYSGVVKAGIKDYSKISVEINENKRQIIVTCPPVEIFDDPVIDAKSVNIYDYSKSVFAPITVEDYTKFEAEEQDAVREQALNSGLLDKAKKSAHDLLCAQANAIIKGSPYNDYYVLGSKDVFFTRTLVFS